MNQKTSYLLATALGLFLATSAGAAAKGGALVAGGRTIAGPGTASIAAGGSIEVFSNSGGGAPDVCVTVLNTGRVPVGADVTGSTSPSIAVAVGASQAICAQSVTAVELTCAQEQSCSAQWRVDNK